MAEPTVRCTNCGKLNRVPVAARGTLRCGSCKQPLPWLVEADERNFAQALDATVPVLVDFWAEWCGPCRLIAPIVERIATDHPGRLKVVKLDTEAAPAIARRYEVQGIPLLVLFKDGEEVDRLVGAVPETQLRAWLEPHLSAVTG